MTDTEILDWMERNWRLVRDASHSGFDVFRTENGRRVLTGETFTAVRETVKRLAREEQAWDAPHLTPRACS